MAALDDAFASLDGAFAAGAAERRIPGVAWGVVADGRLAHSGGTGTLRAGEDAPVDADSVFRIASMTKSFTAATLCLLRDEGVLRFDDPVGRWVPALASWPLPTADAAPITIRDLLTMTAGLPTDNPLGDRQQSMPLDEFERLLAAGPPFAWAPGTTNEYSNLGYGILGRVITAAAGAEYRDVVRARLLDPLGLGSSGFGEDEIDVARLARGYVRFGDELVQEDAGGYGALAAMGGLYSTVRDLATWVAGFLDAFPARSDPEGSHPLRRSTRREMQQAHSSLGASREAHAAHEPGPGVSEGYGYGLFVRSDAALGTIVRHGGGYPGYGTHMAWHPASGLGVILMTNIRYGGGMATVALQQLGRLVAGDAHGRRRPIRPHPALAADVALVERLLDRWDDAAADARFAPNVDLDEPRERRRAAVDRAAAAVGGPFVPDPDRPPATPSPFERTWWLRGERGWIVATVLLSPEPAPRIQTLAVTAVLDASPALVAARDALLGAVGGGTWPATLEAAPAVDRAVVMRGLRVLSDTLGSLGPGRLVAGDAASATWELGLVRGEGELRIALDAETGVVREATITVPERNAPPEDR